MAIGANSECGIGDFLFVTRHASEKPETVNPPWLKRLPTFLTFCPRRELLRERPMRPELPSPPINATQRFGEWRLRITTHFVLKTVGVTVFITAFFFAYFWLLNSPLFSVRTMPYTALDRAIEFQPLALVFYLSLWVYAPFPAMLACDKPQLYAYGRHSGALALLGLGIFLFFPTTIPPADIDWSLHPGFEFLKGVDASGNACPSLHVAFAVFAAIHIGAMLKRSHVTGWIRWANWLWCAAIAYSTLATKQHVAVDLFAGAILGACVGLCTRQRIPSAQRSTDAAELAQAPAKHA